MPDEIVSQSTPAVIGDSATPQNQDPNLAVNPGDPAPPESVTPGSDPAAVPESEKMKRELQEQRRRRQLLETENAYLRGRVEATPTVTPNAEPPSTDTVVIPARPKMENFDSPEAFDSAMDAYNDARAEARYVEKRAKERQEEEQRKTRESITKIDQGYSERMMKQRELYPEVDSAIDRIGRYLDPQMQLIVKKSSHPAALIVYLDRNPQELSRLNNLDPVDKALEMGQIIADLKAKDKPQGNVRVVSQAPDALKIPSSPGPAPTVEDDKVPDPDWFARERKARLDKLAAAHGPR